jgi:putative SOS response-associated peptidase YedK
MPVLLLTDADVETWLTARTDEALKLQKPAPDDAVVSERRCARPAWSYVLHTPERRTTMDDNKTASQKMLDEVRKKYRAWRTTPGSGKAMAQAAFVEAVKRADTVLAESGSSEDKLEFVKYQRSRMVRKA